MGIEITGWGKCTPSAVLTNSDLETILDTDDEWITTRTGVKQRRIAEAPLSEIGTVAAKHALAAADKDPKEIDAVMMATCTCRHHDSINFFWILISCGKGMLCSHSSNLTERGFCYSSLFDTCPSSNPLIIGIQNSLKITICEHSRWRAFSPACYFNSHAIEPPNSLYSTLFFTHSQPLF